ncbi:hypothetical protein MVEN_02236700 [Mycena venus]|uniref:Uncharacterized protein n=1 Tax=Mycena venus TaxID=2733690 RepID=A0A8H6X7B3_9AGAR|nr:hypothetical protein MVEN_02236700 [Mycena venus]
MAADNDSKLPAPPPSLSNISTTADVSFTPSLSTAFSRPLAVPAIPLLSPAEIAALDFVGFGSSASTRESLSSQKRKRLSRVRQSKTSSNGQQSKPMEKVKASPTLNALRNSTTLALKSIPSDRQYPTDAVKCVSEVTADELDELATTGASHVYYWTVDGFHDGLPKRVLTRGSLTAVRTALTSKAGIHTLAETFQRPRELQKLQHVKLFHAIIGALALGSGGADAAREFVLNSVDSVIQAVRADSEKFSALRLPESRFNDGASIRENASKPVRLKRRYSPGKENVPLGSFLEAPVTPPRDIKRRKSIHKDAPSQELYTLDEHDVEGDREQNHTTDPSVTLDEDSANGEGTEKVEVAPNAASDGSAGNELEGEENPATTGLGTTLEGEDWWKVIDIVDEVAIASRKERKVKGGKPNKNKAQDQHQQASNAIRLSIINATLEPGFSPTFIDVPTDAWELALGEIDDRDPLETCGDGAMHVVITEILFKVLRTQEHKKDIFKAMHAPLVTNGTFRHVLEAARHFKATQTTPKYPGNAFEVYAAVLARESLAVLKAWVEQVFKTLIEAAISAWKNFYQAQSTTNESGIKKRKLSRPFQESVAEECTEDVEDYGPAEDEEERSSKKIKRAGSPPSATLDVIPIPQRAPTGRFSFNIPTELAWGPIADGIPSKSEGAGEAFRFTTTDTNDK